MMAETNPIEEKLTHRFPNLHFYVELRHPEQRDIDIYIVNYDTDATEDEVELIKAEMQKMNVTFELERIPF